MNPFKIFFILSAALFVIRPAHAQVTAIRAGQLVDPATGTTATRQVIIVEGGKIKAVGADLAVPAGAAVIDLSHSTVLPGLFDCHTHLLVSTDKRRDGGSYYVTTLRNTTAFRAVQGVANARAMLEAGFTTIRDVGNAGNYGDVDLRRGIRQGWVPGPTMVSAGRIIAPYGGQFQLLADRRDLGEPEYLYADTRDEMLKAIREVIHYGATVIKIVVDDQRYIYSTDDIRFMVAEAARSGLKVAAHAETSAGVRHAVEAGVASVEHGYEMTDELLELAKRNGVVLVPTDYSEIAYNWHGDPPELQARRVDRLRRAYRVGVTLAFGTDVFFQVAGQTRGTLAISCVEPYAKAGIPPKAILQAMTTNAARLLGVEKERGAIKPGLAADLIATPANPLEDISTLRQVTFVMKDGKVFKPGS